MCGGVDLIAKNVRYHHSCKSAYLLSAARAAKPARITEEVKSTDAQAFSQICEYIEQSVIANERPELMTSVYERYVDMCMSSSETPRGTVFFYQGLWKVFSMTESRYKILQARNQVTLFTLLAFLKVLSEMSTITLLQMRDLLQEQLCYCEENYLMLRKLTFKKNLH